MDYPRKSPFERHPKIATLVVMLIVTALTLTAMEFGFRAARDAIKGSPWIERAENVDDEELGWVLNPAKKRVVKSNACGETVVRDAAASKYLMKVPRSASGTTVLFLGDSFTQGTEVSTDQLYYSVFEAKSNGRYRVYAAGVGGYGTPQEYLLLKKVVEAANPRVLFWQLTSNDVAENVFHGRDLSTVQKPRPYYDPATSRFTIRNPSTWILQHSELAKYALGELLKIDRRHEFGLYRLLLLGSNVDATEAAQREARGLDVMDRLVGRVVREHPGVKVIGFAADETSPAAYRQIFEKHGALFVPDLPRSIRRPGARVDCAPVDSHWNHEGNRVAGELLLEFVLENVRHAADIPGKLP